MNMNTMMYRFVAWLLGSLSVAAFRPSHHRFASRGVLPPVAAASGKFFKSDLPAGPSGPTSYCETCGKPNQIRIPEGDERERRVCSDPECGHVSYQNPKVVVGAICTRGDRVLLCQRAIEPCAGKWGYPQGFLELGETTRQGAARETQEEAGVEFAPEESELLAVYNLAGMQVQMIYRVELESDDFDLGGQESSDVKFVPWDDIPWSDLAFPTVAWGLEHAREMKDQARPVVQERTKLVTMDGKWEVKEG